MEWQGWYTLAIVVLALAAMIREIAAPDLVMMAALFGLAAAGVLTPSETFAGFANPAVATVGLLFAVSAALRETGALDLTLGKLLGDARNATTGRLRLLFPVAALSGFLNNAPIVAMMIPAVTDWARRRQLSPSRFLIPLSYASILGSINTVIGTSTVLTVVGLMASAGMEPLWFFELLPIGLPIALAGIGYLLFVAPRWLPDRRDPAAELGDARREYVVSMLVERGGPLVGQSVEEAELRQLPGLFLVEIDRDGRVITPVGPQVVLEGGDRLVFAGVVSSIVDLQRRRGLVAATEQEEPSQAEPHHRLVEAVVSSSSPLVGRSIRDSNFRTVYDAAVIAVHRGGERVPGKIGEIVLHPGDTLLMQCSIGFQRAHGNSLDFLLVSELEDTQPRRHDRAWVALSILAIMVSAASLRILPIAVAAMLAAGLMLLTRCISGPLARRSIDWSILIVIGAGLGIASAMAKTGAAASVAHLLVSAAGGLGPHVTLAILYALGLLLAETLHHNAAVTLMFPIAAASAAELGVDPRPFVIAVALSGACAFASPVTYQTHLMVYGPGGYRFTDFLRVGLPLDFLCAVVALVLTPIIWPFWPLTP
ncbi:MAG: SLC13 family permease [Proteobacteria bacterium]|nr:SLC13 family permease [Pseudomonadota bacterium]